MKSTLTPLAYCCCALLAALSAHAQPTSFTYQGRLNDGATPADGVYDFQFALFDATSAGNQVGGVLTNAATGVSNGLFIVTLDFGAGAFPGADRWLEIGVVTNGGGAFSTLSPRQKITSTPYAIQSANAATAASVSGSISAAQLAGTISSNNIGAGSITTAMLAAGAVGSNQLADGAVTAGKVATVSFPLLLTITNPTPAGSDNFGQSVTAVGNDRLLIGAWQDDTGGNNAGAAYLLSTAGTLLTTFTNPTGGSGSFGSSVAALGSDRVLIGAYLDDTGASDAGAAHLFSANGALLMTFTNPAPAAGDNFGNSVAAVGTDRVLIGAWHDDTGAFDAGAAYLFSTNGALLTTFTNPMPASDAPFFGDNFGVSVAAVGTDRVLIGAHWEDTGAYLNSGTAYLFSTNGALLMTFTNPAPELGDWFGYSVAAVGSDQVLIGAFGDETGAANAGAAYLFNTNGALLTTFTNPAPAPNDFFGDSVAAVGPDRVLIGAYGSSDTGEAYLFSITGSLLATITNPTPASGDRFGWAVAAIGSDRVLIGARNDGTGASAAGAAYVFGLDRYVPDLIADGVRAHSITTASLADGAVTASKIGGVLSASQIPDLDASKLISGTLADTRLSTNVALRNANNSFTGTNALNDITLRLRGSADANHGVGWYGSGKPFAGFAADGPMLFGYAAGGLGTTISTQKVALTWNSSGNVGIGINNPTNKLHVIGGATFSSGGAGTNQNVVWTPGSASWSFTSDRDTKDRVVSVDAQSVLEKVARLPIHEWSYIGYGQRHIGPMAQDFHAQFPLNENDKALNDADLHGVALAAIQGLNQKLERKETEITELKQTVAALKRSDSENASLKARLEKLEQRLNQKPN